MVKSTEAIGAARTKSGAANASAVEEGGQAKLGGVLGEGEEVLGAAHLKQEAGQSQRRQCLCLLLHTSGHLAPKLRSTKRPKAPPRSGWRVEVWTEDPTSRRLRTTCPFTCRYRLVGWLHKDPQQAGVTVCP